MGPAAPPRNLITEQAALPPPQAPAYNQAVVTFFSGEVSILAGQQWRQASIGELVGRDAVLKTGEESYCELQFGSTGVLRIEAGTEVRLRELSWQPDNTAIDIKLVIGNLLAKIEKLGPEERFYVRTETAILGVRGTEFSVLFTPDKDTRVAVKEGSVQVLPVSVDVEALAAAVATVSPEAAMELQRIQEAAPVVSTQQELVVGVETLESTEQAFQAVEAAARQISALASQGKAISAKDLQLLKQEVDQTNRQLDQALPPPSTLTPETQRILERIQQIQLLELPAPSISRLEIKLERYSFQITPVDAIIFINRLEAGRGSYSGMFPHGVTLEVRLQRAGYETVEFRLSVTPNSGKHYSLTLKSKTAREAQPEQPAPARAPEEVPEKERISIKAVPEDAEIALDGALPSKGTYFGEFELGRSLSFRISRQGYLSRTLDIHVSKGAGKLYEVTLEQDKRLVQIQVQPTDAQILLDGEVLAVGSLSREFPVSRTLTFQVQKEGYASKSLLVEVASAQRTPYLVELERIRLESRSITILCEPEDAEILIDGKPMGHGAFSQVLPLDRTLKVNVRRRGYEPQTLTLRIAEATTEPFVVTLKAIPLVSRMKIAPLALVRELASDLDRIYAADRRGTLYAVERDGGVLWSRPTRNNPNDNSPPVLLGDTVCLSGSHELVIVNAEKGEVLHRIPLEKESSHLFGRRLVPAFQGGEALLPTTDIVGILNLETGEIIKKIFIPGGTQMTPATYQGSIVIANQQGALFALDPQTGRVTFEVPTGAVQPVALGASLFRELAFFAGRRGNVACVNLEERRLVWEAQLPKKIPGVFQDLEVGGHGVFVVAAETLFGLSLEDGRLLFQPIAGAGTPALYLEEIGGLCFGTLTRTLAIADDKGRIARELPVPSLLTTRPLPAWGSLFVGTDQGEILEINPRAIR